MHLLDKGWPRCAGLKIFFCKTLLLFYLIACNLPQSSAQIDIKRVIPPSPTVAALGEYGNTPVSNYTGAPSISIPLHTIKSGDLTLPISLSYRATGIKAEEMATWTGLAWSLDAGGVITRSVRGVPDEYDAKFGYMTPFAHKVQDIMAILPGDWADPLHPGPGPENNEFNTLTGDLAKGNSDGEPDMFYFNFGGRSGKFYYNQQTGTFACIPKQSIYFDKAYFLANEKWHLITEDGVEYYFEKRETNITYTACNGTPSISETIATGWYLTRIESQATEEYINLTYDDVRYTVQNISSHSRAITLTFNSNIGAQTCFPVKRQCNSYNEYSGFRLKSITWTDGRLDFKALTDRCDLIGDKRLDFIEIFNEKAGTVPIKKFAFAYDYFNGNQSGSCGNEEDSYLIRLKLLSVQEIGEDGTALPAHRFEYNETRDLPSRLSYSQDIWGYINNGVYNEDLIPPYLQGQIYYPGADRTTDSTTTSLGTLTKITYPTGGSTVFEFENNKVDHYVPYSTGKYLKSRIESIDAFDWCHHHTAQPIFCKDFVVNDQRSTGAFVDLRIFGMHCWDCSGGLPPVQTTCALLSLIDASQNINIPLTCSDKIYVPNGNYMLQADFSGSTDPTDYQDFGISMSWEEWNPPPGARIEVSVGGLRIKSITDDDGGGTVRKKYYSYDTGDGVTSSGVMNKFDLYYEYPMTCTRWREESGVYHDDVLIRNSYSSIPLGTTQGSIVGYSRVTVTADKDGVNGKTVYAYSNPGDFSDLTYPVFPFPDNISFDHRRGLLLEQTDYRWNGNQHVKVRSVKNEYDPLSNNLQWKDVGLPNPDPGYDETMAIKSAYQEVTDGSINVYPVSMAYKTLSEWIRQVKSTEQIYDDQGNYQETVTETAYDNVAHLMPTRTKVSRSDGGSDLTYLKYPLDYSPGESSDMGIKKLQQMHMTTPLVEKVTTNRDALGNEVVVGGIVNSYNNGFPSRLSVWNSRDPLALGDFSFSIFNQNGEFELHSSYEPRLTVSWDLRRGNLIEQQKLYDVNNSYIWGYGQALPIAQVENASLQNIFHTSFEDDGVTFVDSNQKNIAVTGARVLDGGTYLFPAEFDPIAAATLKMTYWYFDNGWKFSGEKPFTRTLATTGTKIDEVRVYPPGAQVTTYTHRLGVGILTATDRNNVVTYYDYDTFGRLRAIRDHKGNIVKSYRYHYRGSDQE